MNPPILLATTALILAMGPPAPSRTAEPAVPIHPGDYAVEGYTCSGAPLAALMHYDGHNLSGPHESKCVTTTTAQSGSTYTVSTTCLAQGDGTPTAKPDTWTSVWRVLSTTRVARLSSGQPDLVYHLCTTPNP